MSSLEDVSGSKASIVTVSTVVVAEETHLTSFILLQLHQEDIAEFKEEELIRPKKILDPLGSRQSGRKLDRREIGGV